jgi:hypothetical protein
MQAPTPCWPHILLNSAFAGRIRRSSRVDDPVIDLYVNGIPITLRDVAGFLDKIMLVIKGKFRVIPRQSPKRGVIASGKDLESTVLNAFSGSRASAQLPMQGKLC